MTDIAQLKETFEERKQAQQQAKFEIDGVTKVWKDKFGINTLDEAKALLAEKEGKLKNRKEKEESLATDIASKLGV